MRRLAFQEAYRRRIQRRVRYRAAKARTALPQSIATVIELREGQPMSPFSSPTPAYVRRTRIGLALVLAGLATIGLASASDAIEPRPVHETNTAAYRPASDSADVVATVERFHAALASGDSAGALRLLAADVTILEGGAVERLADYTAHHLMADIEFARSVRSQHTLVHVVVRGDVAWVTSTSVGQGEARGRAINSQGAELMVLTRATNGWLIRAIHWSSRARRVS